MLNIGDSFIFEGHRYRVTDKQKGCIIAKSGSDTIALTYEQYYNLTK